MANTKKIDKLDELNHYLFTVLKLPRNDEALKACLSLIGKSGIDSSGLLGVKSLIDLVLIQKLDKLKAGIRQVLDQK